jgi:hypothetical protein
VKGGSRDGEAVDTHSKRVSEGGTRNTDRVSPKSNQEKKKEKEQKRKQMK